MLPYPTASRDEKIEIINKIKERLLNVYRDNILAIGVYGSISQENDGPYSDIKMHVVTTDGTSIESYEFIYDKFKIEISTKQRRELIELAKTVDDSWAIKASMFINVLQIYDPHDLFKEIKTLPLQVSNEAIRETMRECMIWEPYETIAKIRNNYHSANFDYLPLGAKDFVWQTAKLIGLANKQYYSTRARTFEESLKMASKPSGYEELVLQVMEGQLHDKQHVY
ncbi:kanamycin nucleotidyltransferase C-terminal domain-containing protein [Bacillus chungangensis]|uniref:Kanamycin nucleotidyltransferase n=1 Tax=Bacillus chungangensis TaxID=587633 RepID=A0ABT9WXI7_9BACI|nr:kanamycin nucleotidyltransferase C-terminal domain-containing protein [Bacillus chungangensis]MDQ0178001.1 kanamycin nucleotidyltransferase [Bacillus chungangensis]